MIKCSTCGCQLTKELVAVDEDFVPRWESWEECPPVELIPAGRFWISNEPSSGLGDNIVINHGDAFELPLYVDSGRLSGCCGIAGTGGVNKLCPDCAAPVATTVDDCWTGHFLHFEADQVHLLDCDSGQS